MRVPRIISRIFHPLLMPTYGTALIFFSKNYISTFTPFRYKLIILCVTFVFTFLLPAFNALILLKIGRIKSLEMESIRERLMPYSATIVYYLALFYLFYKAQFPEVLQVLVLGAAISIFLALLITLKWKISAHTIGIGGIAGGLLGIIYRFQIDMQFLFACALLLSGLIGHARLKLNAHTPSQVYCGFALGLLVELVLMLFY